MFGHSTIKNFITDNIHSLMSGNGCTGVQHLAITIKVMSSHSIYLIALFLGQLSPVSC